MPEVAIKKHFHDKKFHTKKNPVFMSDCNEDGCKLKGDFKDYVILNGDNIVICLKLNQKSVDSLYFGDFSNSGRLL